MVARCNAEQHVGEDQEIRSDSTRHSLPAFSTAAMLTRRAGLAVALIPCAAAAGQFMLEAPTFISVPGSELTLAYGINNAGDVSGSASGSTTRTSNGFIYHAASNTYSTISLGHANYTGAFRLNSEDVTGGDYIAGATVYSSNFRGFISNGGKTITDGSYRYRSVNDRGDVSGETVSAPDGSSSGFIKVDGQITKFTCFGALNTFAEKITNSGLVVGTTIQTDGSNKAFQYINGACSEIAVPGMIDTLASGINDQGYVVGQFVSPDGYAGGYIFHDGQYDILSVPINFPSYVLDALSDINDKGEVVGLLIDGNGNEYAFKTRLSLSSLK